jgi:hypothetical protein
LTHRSSLSQRYFDTQNEGKRKKGLWERAAEQMTSRKNGHRKRHAEKADGKQGCGKRQRGKEVKELGRSGNRKKKRITALIARLLTTLVESTSYLRRIKVVIW